MEKTDGSLDQVRDLLFGQQSREFNKSLENLESRFAKDLATLKKESKNRSDSLELFTKNEIQSLIDRLSFEQEARVSAIAELSKQVADLGNELKSASAALDKRLTKLDDSLAKSERATRQHIQTEAKSLRDDLESRYEEHSESLEREARVLQDSKTDRATLAALLTEMAMRLSDDLQPDQVARKAK